MEKSKKEKITSATTIAGHENKKVKKKRCSDDLTPSRCVNFYVVATLLARLAHTNSEPSQVVCVCQRNVWQRGKKISPAG